MTLTQSYGYDLVNRLTSVGENVTSGLQTGETAGNWSWSFGNDNYGNLWSSDGTGMGMAQGPDYFDTATNKQLKYHISGGTNGPQTITLPPQGQPGYPYDAAGNLVDHPLIGQVQYDGEGRAVQVTNGGNVVQYTYDGEGRRVKKVETGSNAGTTVYVYDAGGNLAAEYGGTPDTGRRYLTVDHLGSTRLMTNDSGAVVQREDYFPYGQEVPASTVSGNRNLVAGYGATTPLTLKFTGKERDAETGLDYFGARYMSSAQGRFTSPDPYNAMLIKQNMEAAGLPAAAASSFFNGYLENPQNWNQYAYVRNNPLRFTDPTGAAPVDGHHLIIGRQILTSPLAQDFTNSIKTGPLSGNGFPNQPGFNAMHRAYNAAVEDILQQAEQVSGDRNTWSLPQWKAVASQILNSGEAAIKDFLDELEKNNPGAKVALSGAITAYRASASVIARIAAWSLASRISSTFTLILFIDTRPYTDPVYREKVKSKIIY